MPPSIHHPCDVLVIGAGSAGLRAAIEAHDAGAHVLIISKNRKGDPHTVLARGGINAALGTMDPQDNWLVHAVDTLREGGFLADYEKVKVLCKNAPDVIHELVEWGARFHREPDGRLTQRFFGAHTYRRTCFYGDWTGKEIIRVLMDQVRQRKIRIIDSIHISKLLDRSDLRKGGSGSAKKEVHANVVGALGIDTKKRNIVLFEGRSIILAAGGYSRVYTPSSSRIFENYGEGTALAYEAGADLVDMEMVQFHPTGMIWPKKALGTLATEAIRGEGGILLNSKGERFMNDYYPERMELGPRDIVARANYNEIISGRGTKHGGVWLDITHVPKKTILERLPSMYSQFKRIARIDISKEKMEVAPTAHYSMGGVKVDDRCRTRVRGLFAVGEVSGQVHGANRLGGNSLLGTLVFGKIAGREAALQAMSIKKNEEERKTKKKFVPSKQSSSLSLLMPSNAKGGLTELIGSKMFAVKHSIKFRNEIQELMRDNVGIIREGKKLQQGLKGILAINKKFYSKHNIAKNFKIDENSVKTLEVKFALLACEAIIRSAIMREESRGAHFRSDFPNKNDEKWKVNIICSPKKNGRRDKMNLYTRRVKEVKGPLSDLINRAQAHVDHHLLE
jgi:succinate dehydrogenase / fumarate reductase flavoprotein subunit